MPAKREIAYIVNENGCHICTSHLNKGRGGYPMITRMGLHTTIIRIRWIQKNGPIPEGLLCCHKCDNPACINPDHAFLGTHTDNMQDCVRKGRYVSNYKGEKGYNSKLNRDKVLEIRKSTKSCGEIAPIYGVSTSTITAIRRRQYWKHIK